jgi:predicted NBD/HSP70 family sugar kinase
VTISNIIRDLNEMGLTTDAGVARPDVRGGRKPLLVVLDQDRKRVLGARLGRTSVEVVLSDITGREIKRLGATPRDQDRLYLLAALVKHILAVTDTPREAVLGLAVATVSPADPELPPADDDSQPAAAIRLEQALGLPVRLVSLPVARAFGECWFYHRYPAPDFFYANLSHRITGLAVRRGLLTPEPCDFGDCYLAPYPYEQAPQPQPTLRTALSGQAVLNEVAQRLGQPVDGRRLDRLASEGRSEVREVLGRFGYTLGCALSLVVNIADLKKIVLGGCLTQSWPYFETTLREGLERHTPRAVYAAVSIRPIRPEMASGLLGALALALDRWVYRTDLLNLAIPV